jgi:hypothetical protein
MAEIPSQHFNAGVIRKYFSYDDAVDAIMPLHKAGTLEWVNK